LVDVKRFLFRTVGKKRKSISTLSKS
jgi:hypothetical protein